MIFLKKLIFFHFRNPKLENIHMWSHILIILFSLLIQRAYSEV